MDNTSVVETTLVEESDERLAAVEEAKRTGEPLRSTGSRGTSVVPTAVATAIAEEKGLQNTYVTSDGSTAAAHLEPWHNRLKGTTEESAKVIAQTNQEKADAHSAYAAEYQRALDEENKRLREQQAEGFRVDLAIQQANFERAKAHEEISAAHAQYTQEYQSNLKDNAQVSADAIEIVNREHLVGAPVAMLADALKGVNHVPEALEKPAEGALIVKDQIIATEKSYEEHTQDIPEALAEDHPGVPIVDNASSPEALVEETLIGQVYAGGLHDTNLESVPVEALQEAAEINPPAPEEALEIEQPEDASTGENAPSSADDVKKTSVDEFTAVEEATETSTTTPAPKSTTTTTTGAPAKKNGKS